ncbi:BZ3500_MvSof-1268-A1-R1_Chr2-1g04157 [Microbotryum saponariae]|uniref:BZ3500_MvSof-1268-A1-R1_Chr2-1g04157 protein n=1 Tax=Microbotryum saponariae TaxID=289078 RepID=A0A2X0K5I8_9BASI|nr:BZ3500_MvSof-1268-A1-R1_Chr2-1g04157 [Microbotryum saponariae]SCZ91144.1 BZ3501_MvSof-1269-A2-R1_Chr2-1g03813 [Microbotryum saponariae]
MTSTALVLDYFAVWPVGIGAFFLIIGLSNLSLQVVAYSDPALREASTTTRDIQIVEIGSLRTSRIPVNFPDAVSFSPHRHSGHDTGRRQEFSPSDGLVRIVALPCRQWLNEDYMTPADATSWTRYSF